jgi:hypothetical protein
MLPDASCDARLPRVDDLPPNVATFMIARAFAEIYRDSVEAPLPEPLAAILRQIESWEAGHGQRAA